MTALVVLAKAPEAGRVKTRLCPPCSPEEAAAVAKAALADTLEAVGRLVGIRRILALDGPPGPWLPPGGFEVVPQRGRGLDERIAAAFADASEPAVLIGMDTPQVTAALLVGAVAAMEGEGVDAVLGEAADGGWWIAGLRRPDPRAFLGVPMSTGWTAAAQRSRFRSLGLRWVELVPLRDVDRIADALAVAEEIPESRFGRAVAALDLGHDMVGAAR